MAAKVILETLKFTWLLLERAGSRPVLMGGLAVSMWGHLRVTHDVDLLLALDGVEPATILHELIAAGMRLKTPAMPIVDLGSARLAQLMYEPADAFMELQVDLILAESEFHRHAVARSRTDRIPNLDIELRVVSCEDLLILKLFAGRVLDRIDCVALLRINRSRLDFAYLNDWIQTIELSQIWAEVWDAAFPGEPLPVI